MPGMTAIVGALDSSAAQRLSADEFNEMFNLDKWIHVQCASNFTCHHSPLSLHGIQGSIELMILGILFHWAGKILCCLGCLLFEKAKSLARPSLHAKAGENLIVGFNLFATPTRAKIDI